MHFRRVVGSAFGSGSCTAPMMQSVTRQSTTTAVTSSTEMMTGTIHLWHPFERRGEILGADGNRYLIPNTRAFESVLPTMMRRMQGAKVTFRVAKRDGAYVADRGIIRTRLEAITTDSYKRLPPAVDLLAAFRNPSAPADGGASSSPASTSVEDQTAKPNEEEDDTLGHLPWMRKKVKPPATTPQRDEAPQKIAMEIVVDVTTLPELSEAEEKENAERTYLTEGVKPAGHIKDLRSVALLSADHLAKMKRLVTVDDDTPLANKGTNDATDTTGKAVKTAAPKVSQLDLDLTIAKTAFWGSREKKQPSQSADSAPAPPIRRSDGVRHEGTVVAWSALHRSGLVIGGSVPDDAPLPVVKDLNQDAYVIRSVEAFQTAMPSSLDMVRRKVTFVAARYSHLPMQSFAESIEILGPLDYNATSGTSPSPSKKEAQAAVKQKRLAALVYDDGPLERSGSGTSHQVTTEGDDIPEGAVYGILTRWSGGQGIVERSSGATFFVASAADFQQLVDQNSSAIRGAVVTFEVKRDRPRYAVNINVLSLAHNDIAHAKPLLQRHKRADAPTENSDHGSVAPPAEGAERLEGFLVSWSPAEGQGVVQGDDGVRYLLRDAEDNVVQYDGVNRQLLKKGRRVAFHRFGSNGLLACHVEPLDAEADAEALRLASLEEQPAKVTMDGNVDEAIASPMSTSYWMGRLEKVGFDVSDVKKRQTNLVPREFLDDEDDPLKDTRDVFQKDRWFNDKDRNIKIPGSDIRVGDLAQVAPSAMMNLAAKAQDPVKLDKMKNKYFNQLSEEMKEHAWKQAKEMAPRYAKRIREARETGEEPTFHFY